MLLCSMLSSKSIKLNTVVKRSKVVFVTFSFIHHGMQRIPLTETQRHTDTHSHIERDIHIQIHSHSHTHS